jgi:hypothetical protein
VHHLENGLLQKMPEGIAIVLVEACMLIHASYLDSGKIFQKCSLALTEFCVRRLIRYYKSAERRGRQMDMYPPGRVIFVRPLKTLVGRRRRRRPHLRSHRRLASGKASANGGDIESGRKKGNSYADEDDFERWPETGDETGGDQSGAEGGEAREGQRLVKGWDAVWVTPQEIIGEGILISGKVRPLLARHPHFKLLTCRVDMWVAG